MEQGQGMWYRGTWSRETKGYGMGVWSRAMGSGQGVDVGVRELWGMLVPEEVPRDVPVPGR